MNDIEALMKRCQIGVPRGPNAYDQLHSILADCYGALGVMSARQEPDCRSCYGFLACTNGRLKGEPCINGDRYDQLQPVRLWRVAG